MKVTAPRYMTRFRCLAESCEDTCCAGLTVTIGEARWKGLREAVAGGPDAERVAAFVRPEEDGGPGVDAAVIAKREDGHCVFLDTSRLCSLQRTYGESVLPDACSTFPRAVTRWGERLEVAGTLACPEVARLCLLAEDGVESVSASEDVAVRPEAALPIGGDAEEAWRRHAEAVRAAALGLLQRRELPFSSRLFALGQLALRLDGFDFRGMEALHGEATAGAEASRGGLSPGAEARLHEVLRSFASPDTLAELHEGFSSLVLPGGPWAGICSTALKARVGSVRSERFTTLVRSVLASYGGADSPDEAWRIHAERRERLGPVLAERVEQYFRHHAVNHCLRHPFTDASRLLDFVFRLTLRAAVLRWTLFGHPAVVALCEGRGEDMARLDAAAVECFQLIAKHVEQAPELLSLAQGLAGSGGAETLGRMLVLLKGL